MTDDRNAFPNPENLLSAWIKSTTDFWGSMLQSWPATDPYPAGAASASNGHKERSRSRESFETVLKTWQTLSTAAGDIGAFEAASNLGNAMPDVLIKMVRASWQGFFNLQQQLIEKAGRIGRSTQAYSFENLDEDVFKAWTDIYEKEFRQFFNLPQLGLTRFYQEKFNQAVDKFNRFQASFGEFMTVFFMPMEKSFKVLQDEVSKLAEVGKLPEDANAIYRLWIKILEGHYMTLYKSPEYLSVMHKTLSALEDFFIARETITQDMLKGMAIPTQKDLDELYREIYFLKKRIRKFEKAAPG
ncbi:MAG: poly(R)-hydroxyalkanoic acid synthase subunit PhaE [Desulfobacterales bacterium]